MPAEDSSSLNDKELFNTTYTITALQKAKQKSYITVNLAPEGRLTLPDVVCARLKLEVGQNLSKDEFFELKKEEVYYQVKEKAYHLLELRPLTILQLKTKLKERLYPLKTINNVIRELKASGLLNDIEYATEWIKSQLKRKPQGKRLLLSGLLKKGLPRSKATELIAEVYPDKEELKVCQRCLTKLSQLNPQAKPSKILTALIRRGFSQAIIQRVWTQFKKNQGRS